MASRMTTFQPKRNFLFPTHNPIRTSDGVFEFDDSDLWLAHHHPSSNNPTDHNPINMITSTIPREPRKNKTIRTHDHQKGVTSASVPLNIPDWSKVMRENMTVRSEEEEYEEEQEEEWVPPHVYLARNRGASFSVHEGVGRTLKGRDLRRVRNAIWKQVGFED